MATWSAEAEAWLLANPEATYEACQAAGVCRDKNYQAYHSKRRRLLGSLNEMRSQRLHEAQQAQAVGRMVAQADRNLGMDDGSTAEDFRRFFTLIKEADALKQDLSPTEEAVDFHAPDDGLPIGIAFTGDWHIGASGVLYDRLEADLKTIGATEGLYPLGMGDYCEGVTLTVKAASALFSGAFNQPELQDWLVREYAIFCDGQWVAWVAGNHDEMLARVTGMTRSDKTARYLGAPYFCQGGGTVFTHVGGQRYVVAVTHNAKGNSRLNTSNAQRRTYDEWPQWENCDVICCGHLHYNDLHIQSRKGSRCVYLRSGTAKVRDGYAADHGFKPEYGIPVAIFYPDEHRVLAFRGDDFAAALRFLAAERARYAARHPEIKSGSTSARRDVSPDPTPTPQESTTP